MYNDFIVCVSHAFASFLDLLNYSLIYFICTADPKHYPFVPKKFLVSSKSGTVEPQFYDRRFNNIPD